MSMNSNNPSEHSSPKRSIKNSSEKENIQVYLRLRPQNEVEKTSGDCAIWEVQDNAVRVNTQVYDDLMAKNSKKVNFVLFTNKHYSYNQCFNQKTGNEDVYEEAVRPIILSSLDGINGTVFMYGQTGAG